MPSPANLVHQTASSTGTGNITVTAVNGKQSLATAFSTGSGNTFDYFISNRDAAQWERGIGYMDTTSDLVRSQVVETSLGTTAAIDFVTGTKDVTNDVPAGNQITVESKAGDSVAGIIEIASTAETATASATTLAVVPGRMHNHPGVAKFWLSTSGTSSETVTDHYNVTSLTFNTTGIFVVTIATDFASTDYAVSALAEESSTAGIDISPCFFSRTAGSVGVKFTRRNSSGTAAQVGGPFTVLGMGDQ